MKSLNSLGDSAPKEFSVINIGDTLAQEYQREPQNFTKEIGFDSFTYFRNIIDNLLPSNCKTIIFNNIGILCEEEFALNVPKFFLDYAKEYEVYILWPYGIVDKRKLVWMVNSPKNNICFNEGVLELKGDEDEIF
jgi:hypothetical protein